MHLQMYNSFLTPVSRNIFAMILKNSRMPSPNLPLWYIDYFELYDLKNSPLNSPDLHKNKRNSIVINLLRKSFITQERLTRYRRGDQKLTPDKLCHTLSYLSPVLLRANSSFPEMIYSSLRGCILPPLSLQKNGISS